MSPRPLFLALLLLPLSRTANAATVPVGTPLAITVERNFSLRTGTAILGHLVYAIYVDNHLVVPAGATVTGTVEALTPDHARRVNAMLGGDFTPFRIPLVRFSTIQLPGGAALPLVTGPASAGAPVYRAVASSSKNGNIVHREFNAGLDAARGDLAYFIAPGKRDRFLEWVYSQLPYHPQSIEKGTSWTVELQAPLEVQPAPGAPVPIAPVRKPRFWEVHPEQADQPQPNVWRVQANLAQPISSETSTRGQVIRAIVTEPVLNADGSVAISQGATLIGSVTRARPARKLGRSGQLTFSFNRLQQPDQPNQSATVVETRLTGADSSADITLNSEGQAKSRPRDRVVIPLILAVMASSPLDQDNGHAHHRARKNATGGAAGLGLVGTVVGLAGGSPYVAAGIGYWGAARSVFGRWIARGPKIAFPQDTRIVLDTIPRNSPQIHPSTTP